MQGQIAVRRPDPVMFLRYWGQDEATLGKFIGGTLALSGIAFVAMPTGIIAAAFSDAMQRRRDHRIEEMRQHLERLDQVDERVEAQLAKLERSKNSPGS